MTLVRCTGTKIFIFMQGFELISVLLGFTEELVSKEERCVDKKGDEKQEEGKGNVEVRRREHV